MGCVMEVWLSCYLGFFYQPSNKTAALHDLTHIFLLMQHLHISLRLDF